MTTPFRKPYDVDILVRGYGNLDATAKLLESIDRDTEGVAYRVTYVDNGSPLRELTWLMAAHPEAQIVRLPFNHGSVRAINAGLALALLSDAPYVVLFDNDTEIPAGDKLWLKRWISYFQDPSVGMAGATSNFVSGWQHIEAVPDRYTRDWKGKHGEGTKKLQRQAVLVSFALMLRKAAVREVGLWDERYEPGNYEDFDYALMARDKGWNAVIAESVYIHHRGHGTFAAMGLNDLLQVNGARIVDKWGKAKLAEMGVGIQEARA